MFGIPYAVLAIFMLLMALLNRLFTIEGVVA